MTKPVIFPKRMKVHPLFQRMADKWPSSVFSRDQVKEFTGGLVNPRSLANLDSMRKGPDGRYRLGRKVFYDVEKFVVWLDNRAKIERD